MVADPGAASALREPQTGHIQHRLAATHVFGRTLTSDAPIPNLAVDTSDASARSGWPDQVSPVVLPVEVSAPSAR